MSVVYWKRCSVRDYTTEYITRNYVDILHLTKAVVLRATNIFRTLDVVIIVEGPRGENSMAIAILMV